MGTDERLPIFDLGPIYEAMAALGAAAVPVLLPLLTERDPERRRAAALLLGHAGDPGCQLALADRVFDSHPRVSSAARKALAALRGRADLMPAAEKLRRALLSEIPERSSSAAAGLAELRDTGAIPLLIQVLESPSSGRVASASQALTAITLQRHGTSARRWLAWWKDNRGRPRARWLLDALHHPELEVRAAAAAELRVAGPPPVPYEPDAPEPERDRAATAWTVLWERSGFVV
jgi:HEAT repeat protein